MLNFGSVIKVYNLPNSLSSEHQQLALNGCYSLLSQAQDRFGLSDQELRARDHWQLFKSIELADEQDTVHFLVTTAEEAEQADKLRNGSREEYLNKRVISKTINFTPEG